MDTNDMIHVEDLEALAGHYGWTNWEVETAPQHDVIQAFAISPNGKHELSGLFSANGDPVAYFLCHEPNGNFSRAVRWHSSHKVMLARRTTLAEIEEFAALYATA